MVAVRDAGFFDMAAAFAVINDAIIACWIIASSAAAAAARDAAADSAYGVPLAADAARQDESSVSCRPPAPPAAAPPADATPADVPAGAPALPPAAVDGLPATAFPAVVLAAEPPAAFAAALPVLDAVLVGVLVIATPRSARPRRRAARLSSNAQPSGICSTVRKKIAAESCTNLGRALLWSPGTSSRFLSPEYFA